jgi:hypothetical protein
MSIFTDRSPPEGVRRSIEPGPPIRIGTERARRREFDKLRRELSQLQAREVALETDGSII